MGVKFIILFFIWSVGSLFNMWLLPWPTLNKLDSDNGSHIRTLAFPSCWLHSFMHSKALRSAELITSAWWPEECAAWKLKRWSVEARKSQMICSFKSGWLSIASHLRVVAWPLQPTNPIAQFPCFMNSGIFISSNYVHPYVLTGPSPKVLCRCVWLWATSVCVSMCIQWYLFICCTSGPLSAERIIHLCVFKHLSLCETVITQTERGQEQREGEGRGKNRKMWHIHIHIIHITHYTHIITQQADS